MAAGTLEENEVLGEVEPECLLADLELGVDTDELGLWIYDRMIRAMSRESRLRIRTGEVEDHQRDHIVAASNADSLSRESLESERHTECDLGIREGLVLLTETAS